MFKTLLTIVLSVALTLGIIKLMPTTASQETAKESVYDRVMRTGTIRCGYFFVPPEFTVDPKTKKFSGIGYDITEAVGKKLNLHIEWVEEVGFAEMTTGLKTGRYDAVCSSVFNRAPLAKQATFSIPFMYTPTGAFARSEDIRFDDGLQKLNSDKFIISAIDGEVSGEIADEEYPLAKRLSLPQHTDISMLLENVADKKADVSLTYMASFYLYTKSHPGVLKIINKDGPIRAFGNTLMLPLHEPDFKNLIDTALSELINAGTVDAIISKYEFYPNSYYRVTRPYRTP
ncbi:MAG: substrate-binding periplasmic protein [Bdellovibrionales bacterium]